MKVTNLLPLLFGLLLANGYRIKALWNRRILFDTPFISYCQPYGVKAFSPLPVYFLFCFCDMDVLMLIACSGKTYRKKRINYQLKNEVVQHDYKCKEQNWSWKHTFLLFISMKVFQGLRMNSFFLILLSNLPNEDNIFLRVAGTVASGVWIFCQTTVSAVPSFSRICLWGFMRQVWQLRRKQQLHISLHMPPLPAILSSY